MHNKPHTEAAKAKMRAAHLGKPAPWLAQPATAAGAELDASRVLAAYRARLMALHTALETDRDRARRLLAEIIGPVRLEQRGDEVWAELETKEPAAVACAGSLLGLVAGAGSGNWKPVRVR